MRNTKLTREKELETILAICVGLVVIYFIGKQHHLVFLLISIIVGLVGMFSRLLTSKIAWAWMKMAELMGAVMSKVILSIVFFGLVYPVALLSRVFSRRDNLQLKKPAGSSNYIARNHQYIPHDMENLW